MELCRIKNLDTGLYLCKSADVSNESDKNHAIIYWYDTAKKLVESSNMIMQAIYNVKKNGKKFSGFEIEPASLDSFYLLDEWKHIIAQYARRKGISKELATKEFIWQQIDFWDSWAVCNPFEDHDLPHILSAQERLL